MTLYMAISRDKYELPYGVADSLSDLARLLGMSYNSVWYCYTRNKRGATKWGHIISVECEEEDE